jgi:Putative DNA-binding domain
MDSVRMFQSGFATLLGEPDRILVEDIALKRALAVHRNTSALAARQALQDNYPVILALVGEDAFEACADAYHQAWPVRDPRLCFYGAHFSEFLAGYGPFSDLTYLADLARLERFWVEVFFAPDATALGAADFAANIDLDAPLALNSTVRLGSFTYPVGQIWLAHHPSAPERALDDIVWEGDRVMLTRLSDVVEISLLTKAEFAFLAAFADQQTLGIACAAASAADDKCDLSSIIAKMLSASVFQT